MAIRVAGIAGSLRDGSLNKGLLRAAAELAPAAGMEIAIYARLGDIPPYNEDVFVKGDPEPVADLKTIYRRRRCSFDRHAGIQLRRAGRAQERH